MLIVKGFALTALLSAAVLSASNTGITAGDKPLTPLKVDLETLASTDGLKLSNVEEEVIPFTFEDGTTRGIRKRTFRFFSQRFLAEDWYHDAFLFEPVDLKESDRDKAILLSHVYNNKMFDEMLNKYGLRSAAVVGVPVLLFKPNPVNNAFFKNHPDIRRSESEWQEFTFQRFRETGDINVTSFAVIMKAKWRALAAMERVLGRELTKVIYCGGSKAGAAVRAMFKEDPRIVSVVSSGSIPFATEQYISNNPDPFVKHFINEFHLRPQKFEDSTIFFNIGSNDFNAAPTPLADLYHDLKGDRRMYTHPNGGHPAIADEQVSAVQFWASHVFHSTPVPEVMPPDVSLHDDHLVFRTKIEHGANVEDVELSYACFDPSAGKFTPGVRRANAAWTKATWTTIPMTGKDGSYTALLPRDLCDDPAHLHVTVRVKVVIGHLAGYVSSPAHNRESYKRYRRSLNQASPVQISDN